MAYSREAYDKAPENLLLTHEEAQLFTAIRRSRERFRSATDKGNLEGSAFVDLILAALTPDALTILLNRGRVREILEKEAATKKSLKNEAWDEALIVDKLYEAAMVAISRKEKKAAS